jgi:predicted ATPase/DNA-binding CsgD family transcriptional regulator
MVESLNKVSPKRPIPLHRVSGDPQGHAQLPRPLTSFVGRERERRDIATLLRDSSVRLLSLTGPGGAGKTRLAIATAEEVLDLYANVWFVPLAAISDADLLLPAIAQALDIREDSAAAIEARLTDMLGARRSLLVLDNFEQLTAAAPLLTHLLEFCPGLDALVTTRTVLRVSGEFDYPVPPLDVPNRHTVVDIERLWRSEGVQLFLERARAADAGFDLTPDNAADIVEICRRVDGLPLGIELAAAQLRLFAPKSLLNHLQQRLAVLVEGPLDQPPRLQTMRGAIAWSYDLLSPEHQALFRCLGIFADGFTIDAAQAVYTAASGTSVPVTRGLGALIDRSLIVRVANVRGDQRFAMLETIREFAQEELRVHDEELAVRAVHAEYYLTLARLAEPQLIVVGSAEWVERIDADRSNIRDAVIWALANGKGDLVLRLAGTLLSMTYARGESAQSLSWLEAALEQGTDVPADIVADALFTASALAQVQGDFTRATAHASRSLEIARRAGYRFGEARALIGLGISEEWDQHIEPATTRYREALAIMQEIDRTVRLSHWSVLPLANLADIALVRHDYRTAISLGQEAVDRWRGAGYLWGIAQALGTVAAAHCEIGDLAAAQREYVEVLDTWVACADGRGIAGTIAGIAGVTLAAGRTEQTARLLGAAEHVRQLLGVQFVAHHLYAQRVPALARERLDERAFSDAWKQGFALGVDEAVLEARTALASLPRTPHHFRQDRLSAREIEVLQRIAEGESDREIAVHLSISPRTVQSHVGGILTKLDAQSRAEAVAIAVRRGLI